VTELLPSPQHAKSTGLAKAQHLRTSGSRENTRRAFVSDMRYFWAWAQVAHQLSADNPPVPQDIIECFVGEHLYGLEPSIGRALHELGFRPKQGRHKLNTVKRRLSSLSKWHRAQGFTASIYTPQLLQTLRAAAESDHAPHIMPQKKPALTFDLYRQLIEHCGDTLIGVRNKAILSVALLSGGRRRSEICQMQVEHLRSQTISEWPYVSYTLTLPLTKSHYALDGVPTLPIKGVAAQHLQAWLSLSHINTGCIFRSIDPRTENIRQRISAESIRQIIKQLAAAAGLAHLGLSPHSLRAGFVTECAHAGIPMERGMAMSLHKTPSAYLCYSREGEALKNPAADLFPIDPHTTRKI